MKHKSHSHKQLPRAGGAPSASGQLKPSGGAPGFAHETGAPPIAREHERAHSPNKFDPARGKGKDTSEPSGQ